MKAVSCGYATALLCGAERLARGREVGPNLSDPGDVRRVEEPQS
jgi:hypothetical protein